MKFLWAIFLFLIITNDMNGKSLTQYEVGVLKQEINLMIKAFQKGDVTLIVEKTHSKLVELVGGKDLYKTAMKNAVEQIKSYGITYIGSQLDTPTELFDVDQEEITFVPRVSTMEVQGKKIKTVGYMIAIRDKKTKKWHFLDGAALRTKKEILWKLFPTLDKDIKLPANYVKEI